MRRSLRVKTGCLRCRNRRKKCDELKPICGACQRWGFTCIWPRCNDDLLVPSKHSSNFLHLPRAITGHGFSGFRDQAQLAFLQNFGSVYQSLICPLAGSEYKNVSQVVVISLREPWIRDALNAFTGYMLSARTSDKGLKGLALSSYQMAVIGMKDRLCRPVLDGEQLPILVAATFLGLVEGLGTGNPDLAIAHFALVARLGRSVFAQLCSNEAILPLYRIILEDLIYNLAVNSMFRSVPETVIEALNWSDYDRFFVQPEDAKCPDYRLSPHFGGNHEFYQLMIEITCFSRQDHCQKIRTKRANAWLSHLDYLENRLQWYYLGAPEAAASMYTAKYQLHALALRIYCMKVKDHTLHACYPDIARQVREAQTIFMQSPLREAYNPALAWPLVVLMCACSAYAAFHFFASQVEHIKMNFDPGHRRNLEAVIAGLTRTFQKDKKSTICMKQDNLGILLCKEGITAAYF